MAALVVLFKCSILSGRFAKIFAGIGLANDTPNEFSGGVSQMYSQRISENDLRVVEACSGIFRVARGEIEASIF